MEDRDIIELYFARSEKAVRETKARYGRLLFSVAYGILRSHEDSEECENDTYLRAWNAIPPARPSVLSAFLSRITRNLALDRYDALRAQKRGAGEVPALLDELAECIPDPNDAFRDIEDADLAKVIDRFLGGLKEDARNIFMRRYWYGDSVNEIAEKGGFGVSKVKMSLARSRSALKRILQSEGYAL